MSRDNENPPVDTTKPVITLLRDANITLIVGDTYTDVKKTGQMVSQYANDDGDYQKGVTPSYTRDNAKQIVIDSMSRFQWQDNFDTEAVQETW